MWRVHVRRVLLRCSLGVGPLWDAEGGSDEGMVSCGARTEAVEIYVKVLQPPWGGLTEYDIGGGICTACALRARDPPRD